MYDSKYSFIDYKNVRKYSEHFFTTTYDKMLSLYHSLNKFRNLNPGTEKTNI